MDRIALYSPGIKCLWRKLRSNLPSMLSRSKPIYQIKGRNFEVPGCGGFLTDHIQRLEDFYNLESEVVCYDLIDDLIEKIQFYLAHESLRKEIALAGYRATMERHTYVHRFNQIFRQIGLKGDFSLEKVPGKFIEIDKDQ